MVKEQGKWWKLTRRAAVFAAVACLAGGMAGCDEDDVEEALDVPSIYGTWQTADYPTEGLQVVIYEGGTFEMDAIEPGEDPEQSTSSGTYSYDDGVLTLTFTTSTNDNLEGTVEVYEIELVDSSTIILDGTTLTK
jgi:hypothetical protein